MDLRPDGMLGRDPCSDRFSGDIKVVGCSRGRGLGVIASRGSSDVVWGCRRLVRWLATAVRLDLMVLA